MPYQELATKPSPVGPTRRGTRPGTRRFGSLIFAAAESERVRAELVEALAASGATSGIPRARQAAAMGVSKRTLLRWLAQHAWLRTLLGGEQDAVPRGDA